MSGEPVPVQTAASHDPADGTQVPLEQLESETQRQASCDPLHTGAGERLVVHEYEVGVLPEFVTT
jgi:hypothetical protein